MEVWLETLGRAFCWSFWKVTPFQIGCKSVAMHLANFNALLLMVEVKCDDIMHASKFSLQLLAEASEY